MRGTEAGLRRPQPDHDHITCRMRAHRPQPVRQQQEPARKTQLCLTARWIGTLLHENGRENAVREALEGSNLM